MSCSSLSHLRCHRPHFASRLAYLGVADGLSEHAALERLQTATHGLVAPGAGAADLTFPIHCPMEPVSPPEPPSETCDRPAAAAAATAASAVVGAGSASAVKTKGYSSLFTIQVVEHNMCELRKLVQSRYMNRTMSVPAAIALLGLLTASDPRGGGRRTTKLGAAFVRDNSPGGNLKAGSELRSAALGPVLSGAATQPLWAVGANGPDLRARLEQLQTASQANIEEVGATGLVGATGRLVVLTFLKPGFKYKPETEVPATTDAADKRPQYDELLRLAVPAADRLRRRWAAAAARAARARTQQNVPKED